MPSTIDMRAPASGIALLVLLIIIGIVTFFVWHRKRTQAQRDEEIGEAPESLEGELDVDSSCPSSPVEPPTIASLPEVHFRVPFPRPRIGPGPYDMPVQRVPSYTPPRPPNLNLQTTQAVLGPPSQRSGITNTPALPSSLWRSEAQERWARATQILRSPLRSRGVVPNPTEKKKKAEMPAAREEKGGDGRATRKLSILISDLQKEYREAF